jgi:hypothetical protein
MNNKWYKLCNCYKECKNFTVDDHLFNGGCLFWAVPFISRRKYKYIDCDCMKNKKVFMNNVQLSHIQIAMLRTYAKVKNNR